METIVIAPAAHPEGMSVREYAVAQRISIGSAYRRVWEGRVIAHQFFGRWVITGEVDGDAEAARDAGSHRK